MTHILLVEEFSSNAAHKVDGLPKSIDSIQQVPDDGTIEIKHFDGAVALVLTRMLGREHPKGIQLRYLNGSTPTDKRSKSLRYDTGVRTIFSAMLPSRSQSLPLNVTEPVMRAICQPLEKILDIGEELATV